jgi:clan AA aspartic protease
MGLVYADIQLINGEDVVLARKNIIGKEEIKQIWVNALVDSGSIMMAISESVQEQLQLPIIEVRKIELADGSIKEVELADQLVVKFKNRQTLCQAVVLPGSSEVLLGAIPMEAMDVVILPSSQTLDVHPDHPYFAQLKMK